MSFGYCLYKAGLFAQMCSQKFIKCFILLCYKYAQIVDKPLSSLLSIPCFLCGPYAVTTAHCEICVRYLAFIKLNLYFVEFRANKTYYL